MKLRTGIFIIAVGLLVASWCAWWFYILSKTQHGAAKLIGEFSAHGTDIHCANPSWSGFPFRVSLDCAPLTVAAVDAADRRSLTFPHVGFTTRAFSLGRVLAIADSPGNWTDNQGNPHHLAHTWAVASFASGDRDELSIFLKGVAAENFLTADLLRIDLSRPRHNDIGSIDLSAEAANVKFELPILAGQPLNHVFAEGTLNTGQSVELVSPETLHAIELKGAKLELATLLIEQEDVRVTGHGHLDLDEASRLDGKINLAIENIGGFLQRLHDQGIISSSEVSGGIALLTLLGSEKGKVRLDLRADHGDIFLGPIRLGRLEPLSTH